MDLIINTDGASRGNPGLAAYGFIIKTSSGVILHQEGGAIGSETNNIAEYTAVLKSLEYVWFKYQKKSPHKIKVISDSQLIIRQLANLYKVKNPNLKVIFEKIKSLEDKLGVVNYQSVPREQNFIADRLANKALDDLS